MKMCRVNTGGSLNSKNIIFLLVSINAPHIGPQGWLGQTGTVSGYFYPEITYDLKMEDDSLHK
ncbi:MAG: hypothetical protein ACI965_000026 [Paraglaciecola sp.]|jgi:hypothetical protein